MTDTLFYVDSTGAYLGGFIGAKPPAGSTAVPSAPPDARQKWDFTNKTWLPLPFDKVAFSALVNAERDRRISGGFVFNNVRFQTRPGDRALIGRNLLLAITAVVGGAESGILRWADDKSDFSWIAEDNTRVPMDAPTMVAFGKAQAAHEARLVQIARNLKDMSPAPEDVTNDKWW